MSKILQGLNETQSHDGVFLLTESRTYKLWESAGQKISEAQLTADQINQIFKQVEQGATAAGGNRTMLGKGKDVASAVNKAWEELKGKVQDSGPIKGVDAMYDSAAEKLKQATGGDEGVMKYVQKYRDFAKKHPIAQSLIYSALIAAAGISGAGVGGAAALGLFKLVDKLLQGEKFSSAAYQGAKTGAMAYGASKLADYVKGKPEGGAGGGAGSGEAPPDIQKGLAADQAFQDSMLNKFPPDKGYTFGASGDSLEVFDSTGRKVFTGDIPLKTMDMKQFADLTNNGQMATPGISSGSMSSDPLAGVSDAASSHPGNPADWAKGINPPPDWVKDTATGTYAPPTDTAAATTSGITARPTGLQPLNNLDGSVRPDAGAANAALSGGDVASNVASAAPKGAGLNAEYLNKVINGEIPRPTVSPEQAQAALDWQSQNGGQLASAAKDTAAGAAKGYSQEYLQKVANGEIPRPMITPEKAQELLNQAQGAASNTVSGITGDQMVNHPVYQAMVQKLGNSPGARQAAMSAAKAAIAKGQMNESVQLSESQIFLMIGKIVERQRKLDEGIMDTVKGAAGKAVDWAKTKGTNLTTKVTADKLLQAWKKAGSPTDSLDVASIIQNAGVPSDSIKQVYSAMKIPFAGEKGAGANTSRNIDVDPSSVAPGVPTSAPSAPTSAPSASTPSATASAPAQDATQAAPTETGSLAQVQELIAKLDPATKEKVISTLKQELTVAESQVNELSTNKLAQYKTAAAADAKKADSEGNYKRGDKRFGGIVKATKKQFTNDEKKDVDEAYGRNSYAYRKDGGANDERHDLDPSEWYIVRDGKMFKATVYPNQEQEAIARGYSRTREEANAKASQQGMTEELDENLHKWFKEKWVRFGPDGKIRGDCARGDDSEGKPKCLPQSKAHSLGKKGRASAASRKRREDPNPERSGKAINVNTKKTNEEQLDELSCWSGYHRVAGTKAGFPGSCAKNKTNESEHSETCPHCGGEMVSEELMNEKKDACYYKVKSRYKVWPSAYASGALVKCRKSGADSWGNGGKKNEGIEEDQLDEKWTKKYKDSINCSNPKGFSQKAHCAGKQKNESAIMKGLKL